LKRILVISSEFPPGPGGIGHHALSLVSALVNRGYQITVMSPADFVTEEEVEDFDSQQRFRIIRYPRIGIKTYINRIKMTLSYLKSESIDTIILTGKFSLWKGFFIHLKFKRIRTIAILHGSEVNLENYFLRKFTHTCINRATQIVAVSNFTKDLLPNWILGNRVIKIIPNGITLKHNKSEPVNLNLKGSPKLLTVGHVSPRKGQHRVIHALPNLVAKYPDICYHIVGRPVNQRLLENLTVNLGVENHVMFHGRVKNHEDLDHFYWNADIFMLLSENQPDGDVEGYGIVALEANEFGLPVVGAKFCGVEDAVDHGVSGYLVDGNNTFEVTQAVVSCIENRVELRKGSMVWAEKHQWSEIVQQYEAILN
jgi:phosphatidylinositol alpha-1,6-mannosyltransferase